MVKQSRNRPGVAQTVPWSLGSQISWHSARGGGEVVSFTHRPPLPPGMFLGFIFTRCLVDPRAMVRSEGNMSLKNPVTPPGIDPGNVRLVAQRLNHYGTPGPTVHKGMEKKVWLNSKCLRIATSAPWYIRNKQIHENFGSSCLYRPHQNSERFDSKVSWCGEPLSYAARQISTLTESWPRSSKAGRSESTTFLGYPQKTTMLTQNRAQLALFDYTYRGFFHAFFFQL